jgi:hypothetical protein
LYEKINELCKQKGVSIYKMCKDTGIAQNVVSNWQNRPDAEPSQIDTLHTPSQGYLADSLTDKQLVGFV